MLCIASESNDPFFNLAIEEILLKNSSEEYLILGINSPSVIIGKHQVAHLEANTEFISKNSIPVIRRISGGGTVYHDMGNLNFTFINNSEHGKQVDFRKYTKPVIDFLSFYGVDAKFEGKNDLKVGGLKISGNAEHVHRKRVLHHGTLLFNTSLEMLRNSIRKDTSCYTSRAVGSNPSSVTNLHGMLSQFKDIFELREGMMDYFITNLPEAERYELSYNETIEAEALAALKYRTWEWNWAYGPEYHFINRFEFSGMPVTCRLHVKDGTIRDCILDGSDELGTIAERLKGKRHMVEDIREVFQEEKISASDKAIFNFF
jgi:lipoate-protein ligase A